MVPPVAASVFWPVTFLAVSVGLFTALACVVVSFSGLLALDASCFVSEETAGLAGFGGGGAGDLLAAVGALVPSDALVVELGLSTAPWLVSTLDDKPPVAGVDVGVSLRSTRGATLGVEVGGTEDAATTLEGVPWFGATELESGMGVAGKAMLEVRVVVSLVGLF